PGARLKLVPRDHRSRIDPGDVPLDPEVLEPLPQELGVLAELFLAFGAAGGRPPPPLKRDRRAPGRPAPPRASAPLLPLPPPRPPDGRPGSARVRRRTRPCLATGAGRFRWALGGPERGRQRLGELSDRRRRWCSGRLDDDWRRDAPCRPGGPVASAQACEAS